MSKLDDAVQLIAIRDKIIAQLRQQLSGARAENEKRASAMQTLTDHINDQGKQLDKAMAEIARLQTIVDNRAEDKEILRKLSTAKQHISTLSGALRNAVRDLLQETQPVSCTVTELNAAPNGEAVSPWIKIDPDDDKTLPEKDDFYVIHNGVGWAMSWYDAKLGFREKDAMGWQEIKLPTPPLSDKK